MAGSTACSVLSDVSAKGRLGLYTRDDESDEDDDDEHEEGGEGGARENGTWPKSMLLQD